jgi:hypothetical protein
MPGQWSPAFGPKPVGRRVSQHDENDLDDSEAINAPIAANVSVAGSRNSCRHALFA